MNNNDKEIKRIVINDYGNQKWLSLTDASRYTNLSRATIRRNIAKGKIKCSRAVGKIMIRREDIDRFLNG